MHWAGDQMRWDRKANTVELRGNAFVRRPNEDLTAEYILLNLDQQTVYARDHVIYRSKDTLIQSRELQYSLETGEGVISDGRVSNGLMVISGERIHRLQEGHFKTLKAEYTTCRDCPGSWSFQGEDVDLQIEGYAFMKNVVTKVKGAPVFWMPYMILPIKRQRQTGLLFPRLGTSQNHGFYFVIPFFIETGRSTDMTIGYGTYSKRGRRIEWEGRYRLGDESSAIANFNYVNDGSEGAPRKDRWGLNLIQEQSLAWDVQQKLRLREVSDNLYPIFFNEDLPGRGEPALVSELLFSRSTPNVSTNFSAHRYRNLLNFSDNQGFDPHTVQVLPQVEVTTRDQFLWGPHFVAGLTLGLHNFTRSADQFDHDFGRSQTDPIVPGQDPIREATRVYIQPKLYSTIRPFPGMYVIPSVQYKNYFYSYHNAVPNLSRGFLLTKVDLGMQFERVFEIETGVYSKMKHLIRPELSYSRIPFVRNPDHPFLRQIDHHSGYNFDNQDIVPLNTSRSLSNYFVPLGHSISYGLTTQLVGKYRTNHLDLDPPSYARAVDLSLGQTFNILELKNDSSQRIPFTRFYSSLFLYTKSFYSSTQYYYYPSLEKLLPNIAPEDRSPHEVNTSLGYILDSSMHQQVLTFRRSIDLKYSRRLLDSKTSSLTSGVSFSLNDYILPQVSLQYDFIREEILGIEGSLKFQSPSRCWTLSLNGKRTIDLGTEFSFSFGINLTGEGFFGPTEFEKMAATRE